MNLRALGAFSSLPFALTFLDAIAANLYAAAGLIALSSGFWGLTVPAVYAILLQMVPQSVAAQTTGIFNGIANTVGAMAPLVMGTLIGATGTFNAGLFLLVGVSLAGSAALLPLLRRY